MVEKPSAQYFSGYLFLPTRNKLEGREEESLRWHVRVQQPGSPEHDKVFPVASTRGGQDWLAQGLNVQFALGTRDGKPVAGGKKNKIPCAVDLHLIDY